MLRDKIFRNFALLVCLLLPLETLEASEKSGISSLYQISTLQALLAGEYDGTVSVGELLSKGDMGLGTLDKLAGEMIVWDGVAYQARVDGKVYKVAKTMTSPFANVAKVRDSKTASISFSGSYDVLKKKLNEKFPKQNKPVLFCLRGTFHKLSYRSVPAQKNPYTPLVDVIKQQVVFEKDFAKGMIVGFRFPDYMAGINATGFHFHFLSEDKTFGGHLLGVESGDIRVTASTLNMLSVFLPDTITSAALDKVDSHKDVEAVEKLK